MSGEEAGAPTGRLAALQEELSAAGVRAEIESVDWPEPVAVLLERGAAHPGALLAVGTHGRSGVRRVVFGSVAMRVVQRAACPVLVAGPSWAPATDGSG